MSKSNHIAIMLADDHNVGRQAFAAFIQSNCPTMRVVGEAANGQELLNLLRRNRPHIVILDLEMPVMGGQTTLQVLKQKYPDVKVIILSTHYNEYYVSELMIAGANAFLSKSSFAEEVFETIYKVHEEGFYFNSSVSRQVMTTLIEERRLQYLVSEKILSPREIEVLQEICNEKQAREIAAALNISENTVEYHKRNIYNKTKTESLVGLVKYAIRTGIAVLR